MQVLYILMCFLSLWVESTAQPPFYTRTKGRNVTLKFPLSSPGKWKFMCKERCEENVLIATTDDRAQGGRYSLTYRESVSGGTLSVSIAQLMKSDSGRYRCGLGTSLSSAALAEFEVIVIDALLNRHHDASEAKPIQASSGEDLTVACFFNSPGSRYFFCKGKCQGRDALAETNDVRATRGRHSVEFRKGRFSEGVIVYVSITQLREADSGRYRCGLDGIFPPHAYIDFNIIVTDAAPSADPGLTLLSSATSAPEKQTPTPSSAFNRTTEEPQGVLLWAGLSLVVVVTLLAVVGLIVCMWIETRASGLRTRRKSDATKIEFPVYENQRPFSTSKDPTYQTLDPATRDQNQIYFTMTPMKR